MAGNDDHIKNGFLRADQIDLKSLDEQLQRHLTTTTGTRRARSFDKNTTSINLSISSVNFSTNPSYNQQKLDNNLHLQHNHHGLDGDGGGNRDGNNTSRLRIDTNSNSNYRQRQDWEIDPSKLVIKSVIARGSFGTVHRGVYDGLDVAVKLLDWGEEGHRTDAEIASLRAAFTQEVVVWHKLDHPNVTKFIGATMGTSELNIQADNGHFGVPRNSCCVVVEYLPGGALKSFLIKNRRRKLAFKVVMQLALDLARGLTVQDIVYFVTPGLTVFKEASDRGGIQFLIRQLSFTSPTNVGSYNPLPLGSRCPRWHTSPVPDSDAVSNIFG